MDSYKELLIKKERDTKQKLLRLWTIVPTISLVLIYSVTFTTKIGIFIFLLLVAFAILTFFVLRCTDLEFEYLYLDKEITVDKIMAKTKRKRAAVIDVYQIEILAPVKSPKLDEFKNRQVKCVDFSAGKELPEQKLYVLYCEGNKKYLMNLDESFVKLISNIIPRKVFTA